MCTCASIGSSFRFLTEKCVYAIRMRMPPQIVRPGANLWMTLQGAFGLWISAASDRTTRSKNSPNADF
jgi:hypothetical protein